MLTLYRIVPSLDVIYFLYMVRRMKSRMKLEVRIRIHEHFPFVVYIMLFAQHVTFPEVISKIVLTVEA